MSGDGELAEPIFLGLLGRLRTMRGSESLESVASAEMWHPAVVRHSPTAELTGSPCAACGDPWPCKLITDVVKAL
jgi:hypothetical protein